MMPSTCHDVRHAAHAVLFALLLSGVTTAQEPAALVTPAPAMIAVPALIPVEAFAAIPYLTNPELSPDGQYLVTRARADGNDLLLVHKIFGEAPGSTRKKLLDLGADTTFNWGEWATDQYIVVSLRRFTHFYGEEIPYDRLVLVKRDTLETTDLGPAKGSLNGDDVIFWARDGSYILLNIARNIFSYPEVVRVAIPSNETTRVQRAKDGIFRWVANSRGEVVAGIGFTGRKLKVIYRDNPKKDFETVLRMRVDGSDEDAEEMFIAHIDADTQKGYVMSRRGGDRWGLHEYDFRTRSFGAPLFVHDKVDLDDASFDRQGKLRWVSYVEDRWRVKWFEDSDKAFFASLETAVPDKITLVSSSSGNKEVRVIRTSAPTDPGTYYVYTAASGKAARLTSVNEALAKKPLAPMEYVTYKARDGLEIPAYLSLPVGRPPERLPLIVMPHGGPFVRDRWDYDVLAQYLANRGYIVLQPNFRGSTGYGKAFNEAGYQQFGKAMQDDVDDGVRWLVASGKVDPAKVCVLGWSYGGYVAQVASFRNPDLYRCAASIAGISDLPAMLRYDRRFMFGTQYRKWSAKIKGDDSARALNAVSSLAQVQAIAMPLFIAHGTDDDTVPVSQSDKLVAALKKAGKRYEYLRIEDGDHSLWDAGQRTALLEALDRFLAANNPTDVLK